jgi:predicted transposase YdaD
MDKIDNAHDGFFKRVFANEENIRSFLKIALPEKILNLLDLSRIELDTTGYTSEKLKGYRSDIVAKTVMRSTAEGEVAADIYFLFEHKSYEDKKVFIQVLKYMYHTWQKDSDEGKPLRVVIPVVFYHGKKKWGLSRSFHDQFAVDEEVKTFLLNYRYILFDTNCWDFNAPGNEALGDNVFLLTGLLLFKSVFHEDMETIGKVFDFWHQSGLSRDRERLLFMLTYIACTQDISPERLEKMLEKSHINGGDIMPTLAQRWVEQGEERGVKKGVKTGVNQGKKIEKVEIAKRLIKRGIDLNIIAESTGLSREEIDELAVQE